MSRLLTPLLLFSIVLSVGINSGCGQGALATPSNPGSISVSPSVAAVSSGETQQFVATAQNGALKSVQWSVTSGSISAAGVLTAPTTTADITLVVTAASLTDPTKSASATVRVKKKAPVPAPVQHRVNLSWSPSTNSTVASYRIYRSTLSGGSYGLEASAITGQTYTDSAVQSGATYYYVATDVDQQGQESPYSAEVRAVIP